MNEDRVAGNADNIGGRSQEGTGRDAKIEKMGHISAAGAAQGAYDQAVDIAKDSAKKISDLAVESHDFLKRFMEENPHTTTAIALAIGIFIGYAARRPPQKRHWWS